MRKHKLLLNLLYHSSTLPINRSIVISSLSNEILSQSFFDGSFTLGIDSLRILAILLLILFLFEELIIHFLQVAVMNQTIIGNQNNETDEKGYHDVAQ